MDHVNWIPPPLNDLISLLVSSGNLLHYISLIISLCSSFVAVEHHLKNQIPYPFHIYVLIFSGSNYCYFCHTRLPSWAFILNCFTMAPIVTVMSEVVWLLVVVSRFSLAAWSMLVTEGAFFSAVLHFCSVHHFLSRPMIALKVDCVRDRMHRNPLVFCCLSLLLSRYCKAALCIYPAE